MSIFRWHTILRVADAAVLDVDGVNGVVGAATNGTDRDTVSTSTSSTSEVNVLQNRYELAPNQAKSQQDTTNLSGINSQAIILVVNSRVGNVNTSARTNIESISVVTTLAITIGIVNSDLVHGEFASTVDAENLNGGVLDLDVLDLGVDHLVSVEELGLLLAAVGSLAIPPACTVTVENSA